MLLARLAALLTSSLDFLQGTSENPLLAFSPPELALNDSPLCAMWIRALFARLVSPPQLPQAPAHPATDTAAAVIPPTLWSGPRCSRSLAFAPRPLVENGQNTVSLPLAVP